MTLTSVESVTLKKRKLVGFLFLALAMCAVGSTVIASKLISGGLPPFTATALRFAIASPIFFLLILATGQKLPKISMRDWLILTIQAGLGSVAYTVFLILGVSLTTGSKASVIVGTLPVVMGILAITMFGEHLTRRFVFSIFLALIGVLLVTVQFDSDNSPQSRNEVLGAAFILLAVICEAFFMLLNKKLHNQLPAIMQAGLMSGIGLSLALLPASYEVANGWVSTISPLALSSIVYYAIVPTLVGSTLWYAGSLRTTASEAALSTAIMPIAALILSSVVLGETIKIPQISGCALVVCAVLAGIQLSNSSRMK